MYRCSICTQPSRAGQARLLHIVLRDDGSIQRELPVCRDCHEALKAGLALDALRVRAGRAAPAAPIAVSIIPARRAAALGRHA